jgi:phosphatidylinositol-3-phosphatase
VADYNWITPDQYNEQHTTLANGYGQYPNSGSTADLARIAEGDNFVARVVPLIMASHAYQDHGVIVLWWDESEGGDDPSRTIPFIIISKDVHKSMNGLPYSNTIQYSHSSFVRTMQEMFDVDPKHHFNWLGGAATAIDLSDLFDRGAASFTN